MMSPRGGGGAKGVWGVGVQKSQSPKGEQPDRSCAKYSLDYMIYTLPLPHSTSNTKSLCLSCPAAAVPPPPRQLYCITITTDLFHHFDPPRLPSPPPIVWCANSIKGF